MKVNERRTVVGGLFGLCVSLPNRGERSTRMPGRPCDDCMASADRTLTIDSVDDQSTDVVRDLGVLLDCELTLKQHMNRITTTCFCHLRRLRQLKRHVDVRLRFMKQLINEFIDL